MRSILILILSLILAGPLRPAGAEPPIDFDREIRPILADRCFKCHGPDENERQAELRLDVHEAMLRPAESGRPAVVPGKPAESGLYRRISSTKKGFVMPPPDSGKKLSAAEKERLRRWIEEGAAYRAHWSFVPPARPPVPLVRDDGWPRGVIDHFILARLEAEGLRPAPEADRATLIRRLSLDLTGLPPTPAEVDAFLADSAPDAYEAVVDRLLNSPHCGERLALDWLDVARFADTHGYHLDSGRNMTRWRDWVIAAFNRNLPFDRFTVEQLAGDLLPDATLDQRIASGFHRNHMINYEGGAIPAEYQNAYVVDRVNTTGTVWLGLTIGCAQCHDHKFDPVSQREYYQLYAFFHNVAESGLDGKKGNAAPILKIITPVERQRLEQMRADIAALERRLESLSAELNAAQAVWETTALSAPPPEGETARETFQAKVAKILERASGQRSRAELRELRSFYRLFVSPTSKPLSEELTRLQAEQARLEAQIPTTMVMEELAQPRDTFILERGQYDKLGEKVGPGVPASLPQLAGDAGSPSRLTLARWLVAPGHPLVGRVTVNRYWQMIFGTGIVKSVEDFGAQGEQPSHPALLDWLAVTFVSPDAGQPWDVKALLRRIVTSATYRQASAVTAALAAKDPENRLLARGPRLRLQAEFLRDQALAISGLLDGRIGGASVSPYQPSGLWEELTSRLDGANFSAQVYNPSHGADLYRRTMYTFWKRTSPPPSLMTFDAPDRETCTVRRARTNTPLQALVLLNDPTYVEAARRFAERLMREISAGADARITQAFRLAIARAPKPAESRLLRELLEANRAAYRADPQAALKLLQVGEAPRDESLDASELAAWTIVASTILNLDETVTRN